MRENEVKEHAMDEANVVKNGKIERTDEMKYHI